MTSFAPLSWFKLTVASGLCLAALSAAPTAAHACSPARGSALETAQRCPATPSIRDALIKASKGTQRPTGLIDAIKKQTDQLDGDISTNVLTALPTRAQSLVAFGPADLSRIRANPTNLTQNTPTTWAVLGHNDTRAEQDWEQIDARASTFLLGHELHRADNTRYSLLVGGASMDADINNTPLLPETLSSKEVFIGLNATRAWGSGYYAEASLAIGQADVSARAGQSFGRDDQRLATVRARAEIGRTFAWRAGALTPYAAWAAHSVEGFDLALNDNPDLLIQSDDAVFHTYTAGLDATARGPQNTTWTLGASVEKRTDNAHTHWQDIDISPEMDSTRFNLSLHVSRPLGTGDLFGALGAGRDWTDENMHNTSAHIGYVARF